MKLAVLLLLAVCSCRSQHVQDVGSPPYNKPGGESIGAPNKQVEYVTGPNVGISGPTVLGGKGQEIQPSNEDIQSSDKERDITGQGSVYSGYQELANRQSESKGQSLDEAILNKFAASLNNYGPTRGRVKYGQSSVGSHAQLTQNHFTLSDVKSPQYSLQSSEKEPSSPKVAYYQGDQQTYLQNYQPEQNFYSSQNPEEQVFAQLQAHVRSQTADHQITQTSEHETQYPHGSSPSEEQGELKGADRAKPSNYEASTGHSGSSDDDGRETSSQDNSNLEGAPDAPPSNEAEVYLPQEYVQYQGAGRETHLSELQPTLHYPAKHQLQIYIPEGTAGPSEIQSNNGQQNSALQHSPQTQSVQNEQQVRYVPVFHSSQLQSLPQSEHQTSTSAGILTPFSQHAPQLSKNTHRPVTNVIKQPQNSIHPHALEASPVPPSTYRPHLLQPHPQSKVQITQQQLNANIRAQYHAAQQQIRGPVPRPQPYYLQISKPSPHPENQFTQVARKPNGNPSLSQFNKFASASSDGTYRQPAHLQRPTEHSSTPQKTSTHRQPGDRPTHHSLQPGQGQLYQRVVASSPGKPGELQLSQSYPVNAQNIQGPLNSLNAHGQSSYPSNTPYSQSPVQVQLKSSYELGTDKSPDYAIKPVLYSYATSGPVKSDVSHQQAQTFNEPSKFVDSKGTEPAVPSIKSLDQSKAFGFSHTSFGQKPGSFSYSIFHKHA